MHIIVDGYNFLRCTPLAPAERKGLEEGRDATCRWFAALRRARGHEITVVFDGDLSASPPLPGQYDGVRVEFAPSADAAIGAMARSGQLVVTSDKAVQRVVERAGAVACLSEEFWRHAEPLVAASGSGGAGDGGAGEDDGPARSDEAAGPGGAGAAGGAGADSGAADLDIDDDWTKALDDPRLWAMAEADASAAAPVKGGQRQTKRGRRLSKRESRLRSMLERL